MAPDRRCCQCGEIFQVEGIICPDDNAFLLPVGAVSIAAPQVGQDVDGVYTLLEKVADGDNEMLFWASHKALGLKVRIKFLVSVDPALAQQFFRSVIEQNVKPDADGPVLNFGITPEGMLYAVYSAS